jgi:predicted DNA-binding transcriptional regulator AlpA
MRDMRGERHIDNFTPDYVCRQTACRMLDMSDDTFDKYVREGVLPQPRRRGKLARWKWSEIVAALDGGSVAIIEVHEDEFEKGIKRAKEAYCRAA